MEVDQDSAQVRIPPPLILLSCVISGAALHWLLPIPLLSSPVLQWVLACAFCLTGLSTILYCAWKFRQAKTDIKPWKTTSHLITTGIYRFSRNPIYLSFVILGLGISLAVNSAWIALMMIPLILIINRTVIFKEERYLKQKFGTEYLAYMEMTRRWI